jgi:DNA-binding winged helix-turn-helix (wHTH) protein/tetratricopeptide (TPR) repeat protein
MHRAEYQAFQFDCFEVQVGEGTLLRKGRRVKIQELPFRLLLALLEKPGQLVSREELRQRLWNEQKFGELDNGLHVAAAKLRDALGEAASEPRFIRTVPRQGYQFMGDVSATFKHPGESPAAEPATSRIGVESWISQLRGIGLGIHKPGSTAKALGLALLAAVPVIAAAMAAYIAYNHERRPIATSQDRLVIGSFANLTGDRAYDGTLSLPLRVKLGESPYLSVISDQQFRRLIKEPDNATLAEKLHACAQLGAQILVQGQIAANSQNYTVQLAAWRCSNGRQLTAQTADANLHTDVLTAMDMATEKLRRRLGEPDSSLKKFNVPVTQATTGSLAALWAYNQGEEKHIDGRESEALADYKLAIDLDPKFALAYARLGTSYFNAGEFTLGQQYYQRAFDLRERATEREKLYITSGYYSYATGEIQRAIEAYQLWRSVYPRDIIPANNLATLYSILGQPEKAIELARAAIRLDPSVSLPYSSLAEAYLKTGDYSDLDQLCNDPFHGKTESMVFHLACFQGAFAQNDEAAMQRQLQITAGNPQQSALLSAKAEIEFYRGRLQEARRQFSAARQSALKSNLAEFAAQICLDEASLEADIGRSYPARQDALSGLQLAPHSATIRAAAAYIFARIGDIPRAQAEAANVHALSPRNTILNSAMLAVVRSQIRLEQHDSEAAIQALEETRPYDLNAFMGLTPAYNRGLSYLEARHWDQAAREFQHVLDHASISPNSPYIVLARLELGRALQLAGDRPGAERHYQQVASVWKDADPDYPPLKQLRAYERELGHGSLSGIVTCQGHSAACRSDVRTGRAGSDPVDSL